MITTSTLECDSNSGSKISISPNQLLFQTYFMDTYLDKFKIDNQGNITTTGTINNIVIDEIVTTNNIKTLSNKTLESPFISNTLNVSDNIKLINTNGLTFQTNTGSTLMSLNNSGNLNITGNIPLNNNSSTVATTQWVQSEGFSHLDTAETITGLKTFTINPLFINQYLNSCSALRTGNIITLTTPLYEVYPLSPITGSMTINLPTPSLSIVGLRLRFRRVGGLNTTVINVSPNIYPINSLTTTNILLSTTQWAINIYCCYLTSTTYAWFAI
jgi:hypothetical protein